MHQSNPQAKLRKEDYVWLLKSATEEFTTISIISLTGRVSGRESGEQEDHQGFSQKLLLLLEVLLFLLLSVQRDGFMWEPSYTQSTAALLWNKPTKMSFSMMIHQNCFLDIQDLSVATGPPLDQKPSIHFLPACSVQCRGRQESPLCKLCGACWAKSKARIRLGQNTRCMKLPVAVKCNQTTWTHAAGWNILLTSVLFYPYVYTHTNTYIHTFTGLSIALSPDFSL